MRTVLHIGLHKTGTSSLQAYLHQNRDALRAAGILYQTPAPNEINHHSIIAGFQTGNHNPAIEFFAAARKQAIAKNCHTLLISSEMLCERKTDIDAVLKALRDHDLVAIAYLRRADEQLVSAYNEIVRGPDRRTQPLSVDSKCYDIEARLASWVNSGVRLVLAPYDRPQWVEGSLHTDFLAMLGVEDRSRFSPPSAAPFLNQSLPAGLIEALRLVNQIPMTPQQHASVVQDFQLLAKARPEAFAGSQILSEDDRNEICRRFERLLPRYRPHFRPGFREDFLLAPVS